MDHFKKQNELAKLRERAIWITQDRVCKVCGKRVGESVFACYPNLEVVHFKLSIG